MSLMMGGLLPHQQGGQAASNQASKQARSSFSRWQGRAIRESIEAEEDGQLMRATASPRLARAQSTANL
jgi:hypothetical protein